MIETGLVVAATVLLHACVFLGLAWTLERGGVVRSFAAREYLWRSAVVGSFVSAVLQLALVPAALPGLRVTVAAALPQAATAIAMHESGAAAKLPIAAQQAVADALRTAAMPMRDAAATDAASTVLASAAGDSAAPRRATADAVQPATSRAAASRSTSTRLDAVSTSSLPSAIDADTAGHASPVSMPSAERAGDAPIAVALSWLRTALPWLLGVWGFAVALAWLRLAGSARALQRLLRESAPLDRADWQQDGAALAAHFALPHQPQLRRHAALASPLATAGNTIVLPDWALDLPASQRRALLAHEIAHLARRDPLWRGVLAFWRGLLCPLPLAALAAQRLDLLAEWRCDAAAAQATGDGRALAACLAHCLERRLHPDYPAFAAAMAAARSPLLQRAEHLLEGVSMSSVSLPWCVRLAPIAAVVAAVLAVPAFVVPVSHAAERVPVPAPPVPPAQPAVPAVPAAPARPAAGGCKVVIGHCTSVRSHNGDLDVDIGGTGRQLTYRSRGDVRFNDQDDGIASLGAGAKVEWEETVGAETRRVEHRGDGTTLTTRYWKNGKEQPLDADGKAWIARIVPQLLREAAIDVEGRVDRLAARGGNEAVLAEIDLIRSDYARGRYLGELLRTRKLAAAELDRVLQLTAKIDSDYEKRQVLAAALASQQLAKPQWRAVLAAAADIGSDFERAELLGDSAARVAGDEELRRAWLEAAAGIGSDFEHRRSLEALLAATRGDAALAEILDAGSGIGSDFELRSLLTGVAHKAADPDAIAPRYAEAAKHIGSDFERREALIALLRSGELKRAGALAVLDAAEGIGSDFECREVLVEVARRLRDDAAVRARLLQLAARLSDFERSQVEEAAGAVRG